QAVRVFFRNDGKIQYYNGSTSYTAQSYTANTWYHFKYVINIVENSYDLYIDDMVTPKVTDADFRYTVSYLDNITFGVNSSDKAQAYINNVEITGLEIIVEDSFD